MKTYQVVIGSQFGDEGKGLITDYLCSRKPSSLVARHCGGSQASHSVVHNGVRHAFQHFGSNSFLPNSETYLSRFFIMNPHVYAAEIKQLGWTPKVSAHHECMVTTIFDMAANQIFEHNRGENRHGSCGLGINETVERSLKMDNPLKFGDIKNPDILYNKLVEIREEWFLPRIEGLHIPYFIENAIGPNTIEHEVSKLIVTWKDVPMVFKIPEHENIVFEGSQGLMLSERWCHLTHHVTRAYTGTSNIMKITEPSESHYDLYYVTRCYTTRHGAGPLAHEIKGYEGVHLITNPDGHRVKFVDMVDPNNVPNPHQGTMRLAPLDLDILACSIIDDVRLMPKEATYTLNLAVTCLDQIVDKIWVIDDRKELWLTGDELVELIKSKFKALGFSKLLLSRGPSRDNISEHTLT